MLPGVTSVLKPSPHNVGVSLTSVKGMDLPIQPVSSILHNEIQVGLPA